MADAFLSEATLDDLMKVVIENILMGGVKITPTEGAAIELSGVLLELTNPRARLSRTETRGKPFSCLGELCWYLAKRDDLQSIEYYIPRYGDRANDGRLPGAFGPRLFGGNRFDQVGNIIDALRKKRDSRQMVAQLFDSNDLASKQKDVPCTCTLQFMIRADRLILLVHMRSNDAFVGFLTTILFHHASGDCCSDAGCGSWRLQARSGKSSPLRAKYRRRQGFSKGRISIDEAYHPARGSVAESVPAPHRRGGFAKQATIDQETVSPLEPYWRDLIRLLQVFRCKRDNDIATIKRLRGEISSDAYFPFVDKIIN